MDKTHEIGRSIDLDFFSCETAMDLEKVINIKVEVRKTLGLHFEFPRKTFKKLEEIFPLKHKEKVDLDTFFFEDKRKKNY
uniref:Uncharacterized protein n=1 Tax=Nelumbo nucifera TaxID=4432 RepID=A0A822XJL9_NELNU|nr:TPA_asm: hypothetical protein HUJ06_021665 [Nelumbo nucifera]